MMSFQNAPSPRPRGRFLRLKAGGEDHEHNSEWGKERMEKGMNGDWRTAPILMLRVLVLEDGFCS
jgi:hypothetical protein